MLINLNRTLKWLHEPEINAKIGVRVPFTMQQQMKWFLRLQKDESKSAFAICQKDSDLHIGNLSLDIDNRHKNARFSIFIADPELRGKGFGSEALSLLEECAFSTLCLHKVWCKTDANDSKVIRFYKRLGYMEEGTLRQHEVKDGKFIDKVLLAKIVSTQQKDPSLR